MAATAQTAPRLATAHRIRRLVALALLALIVFFAVYGIAVRTEVGQRADDAALAGGRAVPEPAQEAADSMLRTVSIGSLVAAVAALSGVALLRRDPVLVLLPAAVIGTSLIATEAFKLWIFERPLLVSDPQISANSYPSGHTTVFASIGLALVLVVPPRLRSLAALMAGTTTAAAGAFVVTADWHRPSDPIGSFLITLACAAAVAAVAYAVRERRGEPATREQRAGAPGLGIEGIAIAAAATVFVAAFVFALARYGPEVDWNRLHAAYLASIAAIVASAGITAGLLLRALGGAGPPGRPASR